MKRRPDQAPLWDETRRVVGCAMRVLNHLGNGLLEKPYENALVVELEYQGIPFVQQPRFDVSYRGRRVGEFRPDLIAFGGLIIETKVVDRILDTEFGQILNYLRISRLEAGLILNFSRPRLEWKRVLL